jgi:hypothetical protein
LHLSGYIYTYIHTYTHEDNKLSRVIDLYCFALICVLGMCLCVFICMYIHIQMNIDGGMVFVDLCVQAYVCVLLYACVYTYTHEY